MCRHRLWSRSVAVHAARHGQPCTNRNWALCLQVEEVLTFYLKVVLENDESTLSLIYPCCNLQLFQCSRSVQEDSNLNLQGNVRLVVA